MKTFIFIIYLLFIFLVPQLYTWWCRSSLGDPAVVFFGFFGYIVLILAFTILVLNWNIIDIRL